MLVYGVAEHHDCIRSKKRKIFIPSCTFLLGLCRYSMEQFRMKQISVFQWIDQREMCQNMLFFLQKFSPLPS